MNGNKLNSVASSVTSDFVPSAVLSSSWELSASGSTNENVSSSKSLSAAVSSVSDSDSSDGVGTSELGLPPLVDTLVGMSESSTSVESIGCWESISTVVG